MLLRILCLLLLYLLFVGQPNWQEGAAALLGAVLATAFSLAQGRLAPRRLRAPALPFRPLLSLLRALLRETGLVGLALLRALLGFPSAAAVASQPFDPVSDPASNPGPVGAQDAARRGLTILGLSLAPNGFVLDDAGHPGTLPLHRLVPQPASEDRRWPL